MLRRTDDVFWDKYEKTFSRQKKARNHFTLTSFNHLIDYVFVFVMTLFLQTLISGQS